MFELPLACFKIRDAVYDFEERDGLEVYMEFKSIELTTKAIKDTRVELVIKSIEIFYEGNEVILEYHAKNNYFYKQGFYKNVNNRLYDIVKEEGKAISKKLKRDQTVLNQLNKKQ